MDWCLSRLRPTAKARAWDCADTTLVARGTGILRERIYHCLGIRWNRIGRARPRRLCGPRRAGVGDRKWLTEQDPELLPEWVAGALARQFTRVLGPIEPCRRKRVL